ncbi:hypothetical protein GR160_10680 [Flavobacterium sp. Sd200]|uniref:MauE/DoxX family redox-associated membrane protein n=1 Tax=Flavobacterium sp. Sd200 TaxID=2692211 RepID=UPI001371E5A4|nr:MauE/DoxX family redox-associated membrane protein [Flavobacterium sp. Sd200]MXN91691.1 hypothetical protein [Flavobacterium sp. Sd200]
MSRLPALREATLKTVCLLYILLFAYASAAKLLDFENFRVQLGQSPLLAHFAGWTSVGVPVAELALAVSLSLPRLRLVGLYLSLGLMALFSAYIYIILHYGSFVPCSCGGILEHLSWNQHLAFNLIFIALAILGILNARPQASKVKAIGGITVISCAAVVVMWGLHSASEQLTSYHNNFTRRFPYDARKIADTDLGYNSYYWAGSDSANLYLGNTTNPLLLTILDTGLSAKERFKIRLDRYDLPFQSVRIKVLNGTLYVADGIIPAVFRGDLQGRSAGLYWQGNRPFSSFEFMDSLTLVTKTLNEKDGSGCLGSVSMGTPPEERLLPGLLHKQADGNFDVDGTFSFDPRSGNFAYVYRYRNGIIVTGPDLKLKKRFSTIDTFNIATLKLAYVKSRNERKFAAPPMVVNKSCAVDGYRLYVNSGVMGKFEPEEMWRQASIIDVYDLYSGAYLQSFYVYDIGGKKLTNFHVYQGFLFGFIGTHAVKYTLPAGIGTPHSQPATTR